MLKNGPVGSLTDLSIYLINIIKQWIKLLIIKIKRGNRLLIIIIAESKILSIITNNLRRKNY